MELLADPQIWIALLSLTALEIVLGIDNIVFIAILVGRLPEDRRHRARQLGLFLAMLMPAWSWWPTDWGTTSPKATFTSPWIFRCWWNS